MYLKVSQRANGYLDVIYQVLNEYDIYLTE